MLKFYRFMIHHRLSFTVIPALIGVALMAYYVVHDLGGIPLIWTVFGFDLRYVSVLFMGFLMLLAWLRQADLIRIFIGMGIGAEIYLIVFQIGEGHFNPFFTIFGVLVILIYLINYERAALHNRWSRIMMHAFGDAKLPFSTIRVPLLLLMALGYLVFYLAFNGSPTTPG